MMPLVVRIGDARVDAYGVTWGVAVVCAFIWAKRRASCGHLAERPLLDLVLILLLSGTIGAHLLYILLNPYGYTKEPISVFRVGQGGMVFYGGLVFGLATGFCWIRHRCLPLAGTLDVVVGYLPLAQAIGRMGCFLYGCCYGTICYEPWAVRFPRMYSVHHGLIGSPAYVHHLHAGWIPFSQPRSLPVHPTQLYESAACLLIFFVLLWASRRQRFGGQILALYLVLYGSARFILEFYRGDNDPVLWGLTVSQLISIPLAGVGVWLLATKAKPLHALEPRPK